ncbi:MAG TPA: helix-turn-helix domain-containing protein [Nocardioidaceae bacterium]|nr:helix-turn-helix domain-containing protein [Nocardioidaceae bacterium]
MHNEGSNAGVAEAEQWTSLVRVLHDNADRLVARFLERVRDVPAYARGTVPSDLVERDAVASFDYLLRRIGELPVPARTEGIGPSIGRDRARRGVPLENLLTAVRLDFQVLWNALREASGPEQTALLVEQAERVWSVVEEYTTTIQVSYLQETALMSREQVRERAVLVDSLLSQLDPDPQDVNRIALALDVDPDAQFLVAAVLADEDRDLRAVADQLAASGRAAHLHETSRHTTLIARWHSDVGAPASSLLRGVRCGVAPVTAGLGKVPRAVRTAQEIADVLPHDAHDPYEVRDAWILLAGSRLGELAPALADSVLRGLEGMHAGERERLLETAVAFTRTGSAGDTAHALYCHRNTVVNRLRRLGELTGLDLSRPQDAALLLVATSWTR